MNQKVDIEKLIDTFRNMADRGTLLAGKGVSQKDLSTQIIGAIVQTAMDEKDNEVDKEGHYMILFGDKYYRYNIDDTPIFGEKMEYGQIFSIKAVATETLNEIKEHKGYEDAKLVKVFF